MSTTIDQRVVEMRFDNKQFENGVSTTMSSLDKLKQKLNLTGASKGLDSINSAAKNVSMAGLGTAVDTVTAKFSALQVMGVTALANITNSAVNAGKNIVKSLTIDPIMSGFSEYETKMGSIQTILANTEHQGTTMDQVTAALDKLNLYADKTIYNFQEMTRNIGTFTAAGVDLDTSVRSIQGIANLAAVSGSTSQQASTAMYQLSQALATGTVKLMDWNSVVNAGMGGKVFQNALIRTAAMLDGSADKVEEWQKKNIDAYGSFRDSLTQGEWLTSEVLTRTLEQFTMAAEEGSSEWEAFKKSLMESGYTEKQAEEILKMANTATDAATKVKTFTQLMDTLKESAQSGWAQTWELIVGDFEEAKEFFTELSDLFGGIIGKSADRRNGLLGDTLGSNWDKLISQITDAGIETEAFDNALKKAVGDTKFDKIVEEFGSVEKAAKAGKFTTDQLKEAIANISKSGDKGFSFGDLAEKVKGNRFLYALGSADDDVKRIQEALNSLGYDISADGKFGKATYQAVMAFQRASGIRIDGIVGEETIAELEKATGKAGELTGDVSDLNKSCDELIEGMTKKSGRELLLESVMNIIKAIHRPLAAVGEAFRNIFSVSSDQLYNGLEKLSKFTGSFVMTGLLDSNTWAGLTDKIEQLGISSTAFEIKLRETLKDHGVDVDELVKEYGSLGNAFEKGAISIDLIAEALLKFDGITESMINGGETADKVRRTFEGLFAIFDIIGTVLAGPIKIGFKIAKEVLSYFGLSVLDVTANVGDAIVGIRDFIDKVYNFAGIVKVIIPYVETFAKAVSKGFEKFKASDEFKNFMSYFSGAAKSFMDWIEALKTSENLPEDILKGLVNGLRTGAKVIWDAALALGQSIIDSICNVLGIQSPSTVMMAIGAFVIAGLIMGLTGGLPGLSGTISDIGSNVIQWFSSTFSKLREWISKVDFSALFAIGVSGGLIFVVKSIGDALATLAAPLEGLGDLFEDVGKGMKSFLKGWGANLKASAWEKRGKAMLYFAGAIAILAASLYVLAGIEDTGKLWSAVGAIVVLSLVIGGLMFALSKLQSSAGEGGGITNLLKSLNFGAIALALVGLSVVLLSMAYVVKQLSALSPEQAAAGFVGLALMIGAIAGVFLAFGKLVKGKSAQNIGKVGGMLIKMSIALLLLVAVVKLVGKLSPDEMKAGGDFLAAFLGFTAGLALITKFAGKGFNKLGGMMVKMATALLLMVVVVKLVDTLSPREMEKGAVFAGAFLGFVAVLAAIGMIPGTNIDKLGGTLMGISGAMLILVVVAKMIATMRWDDMGKAIIGIMGLTVVIALLVGIVDVAGSDAPKIAVTLLAMSVAIGILAAIAIMLSLVDLAGLAKGIIAVGLLSVCMNAMIRATRGASNVTGNLIAITVAIGLMAVAVAALSTIPTEDLDKATVAMMSVMGVFAMVLFASQYATGSIGTIIVMTIAIGLLGGMLWLLSQQPVDSVLGVAASLSMLILSLAIALALISGVKTVSGMALIAIGVMLVVVGLLGGLLYLLRDLDPAQTVPIAIALSTLLLSLSAALGIVALVGLTGPLVYNGILALIVLIATVGTVVAALGAMADEVGPLIDTGMPILMKLGKCIGGFFTSIIEGFTDGLPAIAEDLSAFAEKLEPFLAIMGGDSMSGDVVSNVESLVGAFKTLAEGEFISTITSWIPRGDDTDATTKFGEQLKSLGTALNQFATDTAGISSETIGPVIEAAEKLTAIKPAGDGLFDNDGIDNFGTDLQTFGSSLKSFAEATVGITSETVQPVVDVANKLAGITIPDDGMLGGDGVDNFGNDIKKFGEKMAEFATAIAGVSVDTSVVSALVDVAVELATIKIPDDGMFGGDGIDNFGKDIKTFGEKLRDYSFVAAEINTAAVDNASATVDKIVGTITGLSGLDTSGIETFKTAVSELASVDLSGIATSFAGAADSMKNAGADLIGSAVQGMLSRKASLSGTVSGLVSTVLSALTKMNGKFNAAGVAFTSELVKGMSSQKKSVTSAGETLGNKAKSGARSKYQDMKSGGEYLGKGFVAGVKTQYDEAYDVGYGLGEQGKQGLEDALKIQSPSRVAIRDGKFFGQGAIIGIDSMGKAVYKAGYSMGDEGIKGLSRSIARISETIDSGIDTQPTIRPVLDLSDVRAGAGAIGSMLKSNPIGVMANVGSISTMMNRRSQNGAESEVVSAISKLRRDLANMPRESYSIGNVTYDDGSNIKDFAQAIVRQARIERRS